MSRVRENRAVQGELHRLVALELLTTEQLQTLLPRYPVTPWDVGALIRWFSVLGAVTMGAGLLILAPRVVKLQNAIDFGLGITMLGAVAGGLWLERRRGLPRTGAAVQLLGSFALQGLIVALAIRFSTGSKDWPALLGVCAGACAVLGYALGNRLVLVHALVNAFIAFGGQTGYVSGWGVYWLKMDYPTRFVVAGLVALAVSWAHGRWLRGRRQGFSRVYAHFGLLVIHLALWFFALFGFLDGFANYHWAGHEGQRLAFSALWALVCVASLLGGAKYRLKAVRGYGLTFLIIDVYTFYFQFVVAHSADFWFVHLLLLGGSMVGLGVWLERRLRAKRAKPAKSTPVA